MKNPVISVVVYTVQHHKSFPCLEALKQQTFRDFELIVVDGSKGVAAARNEGIRRSSSDIIAFTEADGIAAEDWVEKIILHMKDHKGITGRVVHPRNDVFRIINEQFDQGDEEKYTDVLSGGNMAFRREVFSEVGLFDENLEWGFNETEFSFRYLRKYELKYCPDVVFIHYYARNLAHYLRKQFLFGKSALYVWKKQGLTGGEILRRTVVRRIPLTKLAFVAALGKIFLDLGILYRKVRYPQRYKP